MSVLLDEIKKRYEGQVLTFCGIKEEDLTKKELVAIIFYCQEKLTEEIKHQRRIRETLLGIGS